LVVRFFDWLTAVPRHVGFIGAILFGIAYHLGSLVFGYSIIIGWLWIFLIIGGLVANLRLSLTLSILISAYTIYAIPMDTSRVIQACIVTVLVALITGSYRYYQIHLAEHLEAARALARANEEAANLITDLSANVDKVKSAREAIQIIMFNVELVPSTKEELSQVVHTLGNLELAASGWLALKQIQESVTSDKLRIGEAIRRSRRNPLGD